MMFMGSRERDCTTARVFFSYSNSALVRLPRTDTSLVCRSTSASFQKQVGGSAYSEVQQKSGVQFIKIMNEEIRKKGRGRPVDEIAQQDRQEHSHPSVDHDGILSEFRNSADRIERAGRPLKRSYGEAELPSRQRRQVAQVFDNRDFRDKDQSSLGMTGVLGIPNNPEINAHEASARAHQSEDHVVGQKRSGFPVGLGAESDIPSGLNQHSVAFHLRIVKGHLYLVAHWADGLENDSGN